jgi:CubicO group peptidase (beta-lactamase class C family)
LSSVTNRRFPPAARRRTAGLLILKHGEIALERYGMGNSPQSRWTSFSTAKSITATLVGAALHDGAIGSLDDRCELYLPRLRGSAYEGVTIRNALRMCSGVGWREENDADGRSDVFRLSKAMASRRPGSVLDLLCELPRAQPQGVVFNYSTAESCLIGALVTAATGRHPTEQVVVAIQSAWRQPQDSDAEVEIVAMIRAALRALRTDPAS